jgi:hypothetical protein
VPPAATITLTGTVAAAVLPLESVTIAPPDGAAAFNVTIPVDPVPPVTLVGLVVNEEMLTACTLTVRTEFCEPLYVALTVT